MTQRSSNFRAGQVSLKVNTWQALGAPLKILSTISGYRIPFVCAPPKTLLDSKTCQQYQVKASSEMTQEINKMLQCGAVERCLKCSGFLSPLFLRRKSDGSNRAIFNLKSLNNYLNPPKFSLINHHKVPLCLNNLDFMVKIDLSQAYYHIPIVKSHRRYLAFSYNNKIYNMTCLPFGLATAPFAFAKVTNWVANLFREKGIKVIVYLDDFLIINAEPNTLQQQSIYVQNQLEELGWCINYTKSTLTPSRRVEFLGILWDTKQNIKSLPEPKILRIIALTEKILKQQWWTWHLGKVLLGHLTFASFTVPLGRLHCRRIQVKANHLPKRERHKKFQLPRVVAQELQWWLKNIKHHSPIHQKEATTFVTTDASKTGWGAMVNNEKLCGLWTPEQIKWHSNQKELFTVLEVLKILGPKLKNRSVMLQTDNKAVVAYITKEGGTKSAKLLQTTREIFHVATVHQITLVARYLPGRYNATADSLSRLNKLPEWSLNRRFLSHVFQMWGTPVVDLFASSRSAVVKDYVSEDARDPNCLFVDAFSRPWRFRLGWLFPPPALIPRTLRHLLKSTGVYLLVAPRWERTFWKTELRQRALCPPLTIPSLQENLVDLRTGHPPAGIKNLCLQVWRVQAGPISWKVGPKKTEAW